MLVVVVNEGLKVANLDHLTFLGLGLDETVHLHRLVGVLCEELLYFDIVKQLVLGQP